MTREPAVTGHARGHRHLPPPPREAAPKGVTPKRGHDQPWVPKSSLAGRSRRSPHQ